LAYMSILCHAGLKNKTMALPCNLKSGVVIPQTMPFLLKVALTIWDFCTSIWILRFLFLFL
jgi:hypothetical protein